MIYYDIVHEVYQVRKFYGALRSQIYIKRK